MVVRDVYARSRAFVPWGLDDGVPELFVPGPRFWYQREPTAVRRANVKVRSLPDGTPQLLSPAPGGARLFRLSDSPVRIDIESDWFVMDAVVDAEGYATILEYSNPDDALRVRRVRPDGTFRWTMSDVPLTRPGYPREHAKLLADIRCRVFLTADELLMRVDDESGELLPGPGYDVEAMYSDGRLGFVRYDDTRNIRDWVSLDLTTGGETTVECREEAGYDLNVGSVGVDAAGRVYGEYEYLGRMTPTGLLDWCVELGGITVSRLRDITVLSASENGSRSLLQESGRVFIEQTPDTDAGWLAGRRDDGGYVLYAPDDEGIGELLYLDANGRSTGSEPADSDVWSTIDYAQCPGPSSVTPDGEVLVAVLTRDGVHVVGLSPDKVD